MSVPLGRSCPVGRVLCSWPEGLGWRLTWRKLQCTLMAPSACKIRRGCNVFLVPIQIIPRGVPKRGSHPLRDGSKMRWHVSGSSFGMNPWPSIIAHYRMSSPTLKHTQPPCGGRGRRGISLNPVLVRIRASKLICASKFVNQSSIESPYPVESYETKHLSIFTVLEFKSDYLDTVFNSGFLQHS